MKQRYLAAMPPAELRPFLQTWLFFGLLCEVLGGLYNHDDYVITCSNGDNKTIITTAVLVSKLEEWGARIKQAQCPSNSVTYKHVTRCLKLTHACLAINDLACDNDLLFHLASVAEIVGYAANKAFNVAWTDNFRQTLIPRSWVIAVKEDFLETLLLVRSNCCPSQVQMLIEAFRSPQALAFVASCLYDSDRSRHACCNQRQCLAGSSVASTCHVSGSC